MTATNLDALHDAYMKLKPHETDISSVLHEHLLGGREYELSELLDAVEAVLDNAGVLEKIGNDP